MSAAAGAEAIRRGRLALDAGDVLAARKAFATAISLLPDSPHAYLWAANAETHLGKFQDALALTDKALSLTENGPQRSVALQMRVRLLLRTNKFRLAEEAASEAVKNQPNNGVNHAFHAATLWKLKKFRAAEAGFKHAVAMAPDATMPLTEYARFLKARLRLKEAMAFTEQAAQLQPDDHDIMILRGYIAYQMDRLDVAYDMAVWVLSRQANHKEAHRLLAQIKSRQTWFTAPYWMISSAYARAPRLVGVLCIFAGGMMGFMGESFTRATSGAAGNSVAYGIYALFVVYGAACVGHVNNLVKREQELIKLRQDY